MHPEYRVNTLAGIWVLLVLRTAELEDVEGYSLVRKSYVSGILDGEAAKGDADLETICPI